MYETAEYNGCRTLIKELCLANNSEEDIKYLNVVNGVHVPHPNMQSLAAVLPYMAFTYAPLGWPANMTPALWVDIFNELYPEIMDALTMPQIYGPANFHPNSINRQKLLATARNPKSCWSRYKYKLLHEKGFSQKTVDCLEADCKWVVDHLRLPSDAYGTNSDELSKYVSEGNCLKGLVIGNVQSGKTGNMAGVIAMAADIGFNFFVVLTGTLENLRVQTEKRLFRDLSQVRDAGTGDYAADNDLFMNWHFWDHLNPRDPDLSRHLSQMSLSDDALGIKPDRYITVCLKEHNNLEHLLAWLQEAGQAHKTSRLKVLVIDDECDQASINGSSVLNDEEARIFQLIKGVCHHQKTGPKNYPLPVGQAYACCNYVGYTATPYGNILNDGDSEDSLFPRDFIAVLPPSPSYWGPDRLFGRVDAGNTNPGFNTRPFLVEIDPKDIATIKKVHKDEPASLPSSLTDSIMWFIAAAAIRRQRLGLHETPISMLIHTSGTVIHHERIGRKVMEYLRSLANNKAQALTEIKAVYETECKRLPLEDFNNYFTDYEPLKDHTVQDYPPFSEIEADILDILASGAADATTPSKDASGQDVYKEGVQVYKYIKGFNIAIDNSKQLSETRIHFPVPGQKLGFAPLFIIVGGNTLSRGLTIDGLISTYFVRTVKQGDSLMQMGRWFGYRFDYELLPRIWLEADSLVKFCFLNEVDNVLRSDLKNSMDLNRRPSDFVPEVRDTRNFISNFSITSANKMQMAEISEANYGTGDQMVCNNYSLDQEVLENNRKAVVELLLPGIPAFKHAVEFSRHNYFAESVSSALVCDFLERFNAPEHDKSFGSKKLIVDYIKRTYGSSNSWTVIVAGNVPNGELFKFGPDDCYEIGKTKYRSEEKPEGFIKFKHRTSPADFVADISHAVDIDPSSGIQPFNSPLGHPELSVYRSSATVFHKNKNPLLVIGCMSKDGLNSYYPSNPVSQDVFGISLYFPTIDGSANCPMQTRLRCQNVTKEADVIADVGENDA